LRNLRFGAAFMQRAFSDLFALGFHTFDHGFEIGPKVGVGMTPTVKLNALIPA